MTSPIGAMRIVARHLNTLEVSYTFLGAAVLPLLVDALEVLEIRPTKDVDVAIEVVTLIEHYQFENRLRKAGFQNDIRPNAPICRWIIEDVTVDIMPTHSAVLGMAVEWFQEALETANSIQLGEGVSAPVISPGYFLATKLAAFRDRGIKDLYASKDLEDILTLLDGCENIVSLMEKCSESLRKFIALELQTHVANRNFLEAVPGYFRSDSISRGRLKIVQERLNQLARH